MNLPAGLLEGIGTSPLVVTIAVLIMTSLLLFFFVPAFFNLTNKTKISRGFGFIKEYPRRSLAFVIVGLVFIFGLYAFYYVNQPMRVVTATQFKLEKSASIKQLQEQGLGSWRVAGVYFLDIRSREEYAKEHLKGSESLPTERAIKGKYPFEKIDMAVYSSSSKFEEARKVAEAIKKNGDAAEDKYKEKFGKIYVIKDGFEGLKAAGLITESGIWD